MLHDFLEGRVFLPNDFVESSSLDPGFLELLIRCSGFHGLVLACITNQQNAVAIFEPVQKLVHLLCACEARFVQNVQVFLYASLVIVLVLRKMPLERARFDSGLPGFARPLRVGSGLNADDDCRFLAAFRSSLTPGIRSVLPASSGWFLARIRSSLRS